MSTSPASCPLRIEIEMQLDELGNPQAPFVPEALVRVRMDKGLDLSRGGKSVPYPEINILANRPGLRELAYRLLAMAYKTKAAEESGFHIHLDLAVPLGPDTPNVVICYDDEQPPESLPPR